MLREMRLSELSKVEQYIQNIHTPALEYYTHGIGQNKGITLVYDQDNTFGVVAIVESDNFVLIYISFDETFNPNLVLEIDNIVQDSINRFYPLKDVCLNINYLNTAFIEFYKDKDFQVDMYGLEFSCYNVIGDVNMEGLVIQSFDDSESDTYIQLLDAAFKPIDQLKGHHCNNHYEQNKSHYIAELKQADKGNNFGAVYYKGKLIGLYTLSGNYIKDIAILPKMQRQGFGTCILKHCLHVLIHERNYQKVMLRTEVINEQAQNFYLKNNFIVTGRFAEHTYKPVN